MIDQRDKIHRVIVGFGGLVLIVSALGILALFLHLIMQESPQDAYDRGRRDGHTQGYLKGTYQVVRVVDEYHHDNLIEAWDHDMRGCFGDDVIDEFLVSRDSS